MSRVFVVQRQQRWCSVTNRLVDKFDLSSAERFGPMVYLLSPKAAPFNPSSVISELHERLADYTCEDHLLLVGNPCLIGFAVAVASDRTESGVVNLLQWSGKEQRYISIAATVFPEG